MVNNKIWTLERAQQQFSVPFFDLIYKAHSVHRENFDHLKIQTSALMSLQTGGCTQDCAYCAQSIKNGVHAPKQPISDLQTVISAAKNAQKIGASRFCMSASGNCQDNDTFDKICEIVSHVKALGLETCLTIGMLTKDQACKLRKAGLDYYNHNVDTSKEYYSQVITTRSMDDRIRTIKIAQGEGINICSGGIIGMGETNEDRLKMLVLLANLSPCPASVPINKLVPIPNTRLENAPPVEIFDFIKIVALIRIMMPSSYIRLSAGRESMSEQTQAFCFFCGANSIFIGSKLLTVQNSEIKDDRALLEKLQMKFC